MYSACHALMAAIMLPNMPANTTVHLDIDAVPARQHTWRGVIIKSLAALLLVGCLFLLFHFVLEPYMLELEAFMRRLGPWGPILFILIFLIGTSLFVPESILAISAGAIFGLWMGLVWVVVAGTLTAVVIFVLGRHFLQQPIERLLEGHPKIKAVDAAASSAGFKLIFLLRLSPLNYSLLCWLLAVSKARFRSYLLACLGMFPGNFSTVYVGFAAKHAADLAKRVKDNDGHLPAGDSMVHEVTLFLGLAAAILASVVVARIAMKAIKRAAEDAQKHSEVHS